MRTTKQFNQGIMAHFAAPQPQIASNSCVFSGLEVDGTGHLEVIGRIDLVHLSNTLLLGPFRVLQLAAQVMRVRSSFGKEHESSGQYKLKCRFLQCGYWRQKSQILI